jgi:CRISPR-associated protein Cmr5
MTVHTNSQKMAQAAYQRIMQRKPKKDFVSFARGFPSLVHSCGLAQAVAFAKSKKHVDYLDDLAAVLQVIGHSDADSSERLERATREQSVAAYVRLSRNALQAAGWLKRYVEAAEEE